MAPGAPRLVLASFSASRRALLEKAGLRFDAQPVAVDEAAIRAAMRAKGAAEDAPLALADAKAQRVRDSGAMVIGADQMLVCEGTWFDKPLDLAAARAQLLALRGRRHELVTAVACWQGGRPVWRHVARPALVMRAFSDAFLEAYLAAEGAAVLASVGAYRLEGLGAQLFERVDGDYPSVLGLPLLPLLEFLRQSRVILV